MVKGGMLKDDQEWAKAGIKPGAKLMMMGTADAVPQAPAAQQVPETTQPQGLPSAASRLCCSACAHGHQRSATSSPAHKGGTGVAGCQRARPRWVHVSTLPLMCLRCRCSWRTCQRTSRT